MIPLSFTTSSTKLQSPSRKPLATKVAVALATGGSWATSLQQEPSVRLRLPPPQLKEFFCWDFEVFIIEVIDMGMKFLSLKSFCITPKDKNSVPVSIEVNIKESINWNFFLFLLILYHLLDVLFSCEMLLALSFDKKCRVLSSVGY